MTWTVQPKPTVARTAAITTHFAAARPTTPPTMPTLTGTLTSSRPSLQMRMRETLPFLTRTLILFKTSLTLFLSIFILSFIYQ